jgi:hypothetical protein
MAAQKKIDNATTILTLRLNPRALRKSQAPLCLLGSTGSLPKSSSKTAAEISSQSPAALVSFSSKAVKKAFGE